MPDPVLQAALPLARAERAQPPLGPSDALRADDSLLGDEPGASRDESAAVLVVDDDPAVREVLTAILREEGYGVQQAAGADEALEMLRGPEMRLPIVLSDLKMPDHDGQWLLDQILQRH